MTKKILITGKNSYVGNQLADWLNKEPEKYTVVKESVRDGKWKEIDFSVFDVVVHVAGIAHIKETKKNEKMYYEVNRDLAYSIAKKAKFDGVKQFIFLSTMSVYGLKLGVIGKDTVLNPTNAYGKSKLEAEQLIGDLASESFKISIIRPPMVYGANCKGNYSKISRLALKLPIFPKVDNKRSMIYIDNLSEFVKQVINNKSAGVFFPQNAEYVNTSELVKLIAEVNGIKMKMTTVFNPLIKLLSFKVTNKVFGTLIYKKDLSEYNTNYWISNFQSSIKATEGKK